MNTQGGALIVMMGEGLTIDRVRNYFCFLLELSREMKKSVHGGGKHVAQAREGIG